MTKLYKQSLILRTQAQQSHYGHHVKARQRRRVEVWFVKRRVAQAPAVQAG